MELGGNIELEGFSRLDNSDLIIVKKMVGQFAKHVGDENEDFEGLKITAEKLTDNAVELTGELQLGDSKVTNETKHKNLYFALNKCLEGLAQN